MDVKELKPRGFITYLNDNFVNTSLIGVEVGVWNGQNSLFMLKNLNLKKLYLIDSWKSYDDYVINYGDRTLKEEKNGRVDSAYKDTLKRTKNYKDKVQIIPKYSHQAIDDINEKVDFVYIDGNHTYKYVKRDLELYWDIIKKGGVLLGHDFHVKDVACAVIDFTREKGIDFYTFYVGGFDVDFIIPKLVE